MADYTVIRQSRKSVAMIPQPNGGLEVRAPYALAEEEIARIVAQHAAGLERIRANLERREASRRAFSIQPGGTLRYLGRDYPIGSGPVGFDGQAFYVPDGAKLAQVKPEVIALYRRLAQAELLPRVRLWARRMGVSYRAVKVNGAARRWGSCSTAGNLNFTWRLLLASPEAVDAVVIHELAHRIIPGHTPAFWALVRTHCPQLDACEAELKALALRLEAEDWS